MNLCAKFGADLPSHLAEYKEYTDMQTDIMPIMYEISLIELPVCGILNLFYLCQLTH